MLQDVSDRSSYVGFYKIRREKRKNYRGCTDNFSTHYIFEHQEFSKKVVLTEQSGRKNGTKERIVDDKVVKSKRVCPLIDI